MCSAAAPGQAMARCRGASAVRRLALSARTAMPISLQALVFVAGLHLLGCRHERLCSSSSRGGRRSAAARGAANRAPSGWAPAAAGGRAARLHRRGCAHERAPPLCRSAARRRSAARSAPPVPPQLPLLISRSSSAPALQTPHAPKRPSAGGGPAGLGAALLLARSRRKVAVFDSGNKRNEASLVQHAVLGADGATRRTFLESALEQVGGRWVGAREMRRRRPAELAAGLPAALSLRGRSPLHLNTHASGPCLLALPTGQSVPHCHPPPAVRVRHRCAGAPRRVRVLPRRRRRRRCNAGRRAQRRRGRRVR